MQADDTFWSDTMAIYLSNEIESSIDVPEAIAKAVVAHLTSNGQKVSRIEVSEPGTKNIHSHREIFIESDVNFEIVNLLEEFLNSHGIRFTKFGDTGDKDLIDLRYDLNNVSVWK